MGCWGFVSCGGGLASGLLAFSISTLVSRLCKWLKDGVSTRMSSEQDTTHGCAI